MTPETPQNQSSGTPQGEPQKPQGTEPAAKLDRRDLPPVPHRPGNFRLVQIPGLTLAAVENDYAGGRKRIAIIPTPPLSVKEQEEIAQLKKKYPDAKIIEDRVLAEDILKHYERYGEGWLRLQLTLKLNEHPIGNPLTMCPCDVEP